MGKINISRWLLGGIVAGIVGDLIGYLVDGVWLAPRWANGMSALGHSSTFTSHQLIWFNVLGIVAGLTAVWIYAAIRPRFGAGVMTAVYAGIAAWILAVVIPNSAFMCVDGLFSKHLALYTTIGALFEYVVGTVIGAWLYQEK
ncbi:MAG: hypothetical protein WCF17_00830 [Terracidiphilus sp.]